MNIVRTMNNICSLDVWYNKRILPIIYNETKIKCNIYDEERKTVVYINENGEIEGDIIDDIYYQAIKNCIE